MKNLKERIQGGETVHGSWLNLGSHVATDIMGQAGFDWLLIDMEHGSGFEEMMFHQLQVLAAMEVTPLVRTSDATRGKIQQILDSGGQGIMFPQIMNVEEAKNVTQLMYYPPKGTRGMAKITRATHYGRTAREYLAELDKTLLGIIQIETASALREVEAIAALDGVDVLFVGPTDLSVSLDTNGLQHPVFQKALKDVASAAKKYGKTAGVIMHDISEYDMYAKLGYRFLACGGDSHFLLQGANSIAESLRAKLNQ